MPARENTRPEALAPETLVCEVLLLFGGMVLACCQDVCDVLDVEVMNAEVRGWHLCVVRTFLPNSRHQDLISTSPLGGVAVVSSAKITHHEYHAAHTVTLCYNPITRTWPDLSLLKIWQK